MVQIGNSWISLDFSTDHRYSTGIPSPKRQSGPVLSKIILVFLFCLAAIQVIKPLGWPGLKKRGDAWKLVAGAVCATFAALVLSALFQGM